MVSEELISVFYPFNRLKNKALKKLMAISIVQEYKKDQTIYKQGDAPDYFYFLLKGRALALSEDKEASGQIELIRKGICFGIISLFTGEPHSVTVKSIENSIVLKIEDNKFKDFIKTNPSLAFDFSAILSKRVKRRLNVPKRIFQSTAIFVLALDSNKDTFKYVNNLAVLLSEKGLRKVMVAELSEEGLSSSAVTGKEINFFKLDSGFKEEKMDYFTEKGKFVDYLHFEVEQNHVDMLDSLANFLLENYHFILYVKRLRPAAGGLRLLSVVDHLQIVVNDNVDSAFRTYRFVSAMRQNKRTPFAVKIISFEGKKEKFPAGKKSAPNLERIILSRQDHLYFEVLSRIYRELSEKTIGIALGSGGAYGIAHIGVLKVIDRHKIPIDMICGSSIGSVIASLWALGYSYEEMEEKIEILGKKINLFSLFGFSLSLKGILRSRKLESALREIFGNKTFNDLKHNLRVVTFNFKKRRITVIKEGFIYKAIAASCAMPGIFEPVDFKGNILMDGGILSPLPTKTLLNNNIKKIIAVNVIPHREDMKELYSKKMPRFNIFHFIFGSIETMQQEFIRDSLEAADIVIHPNFEGLSWTDFSRISEFINKGESAASLKIEGLKNLAFT